MTQVSETDAIVAGAGVWGCTVARTLADAGLRVLVLERRSAPGGNCRCRRDPESGAEVHVYGSHIFHTSDPKTWAFVNRFTAFNGYQHKVLARHAGRTYFMPLGLALVNAFFGKELAPAEVPAFIAAETASAGLPGTPRNFEEQAISFVGRRIYEAFIKNYTAKQWGRDPKELDASIIRRLPVRASYDVNYFSDVLQGIPRWGYNALFDEMLSHPNIDLRTGVDFLKERPKLPAGKHVFYSGPVDELLGWRFGPLPWRTLRFELENAPVADWQGTSVVNYVDADVPYTRIHEFKHFHPEDAETMARPCTTICREYPATWKPGDEPYYPVNDAASAALLGEYRAAAAREFPDVTVGGRLGGYRYLDMDKSMTDAIATAEAFLKKLRNA